MLTFWLEPFKMTYTSKPQKKFKMAKPGPVVKSDKGRTKGSSAVINFVRCYLIRFLNT